MAPTKRRARRPVRVVGQAVYPDGERAGARAAPVGGAARARARARLEVTLVRRAAKRRPGLAGGVRAKPRPEPRRLRCGGVVARLRVRV